MAALTLGLAERLHARAIEAAISYKKAEAHLIDILQQIDAHRIYLKRGHPSLYAYVTSELRLGENVAYSLITVARKAAQVPELKAKLQAGAITLSNARRIVSVLTPKNKAEWLLKAEKLSQRALEKEIARVRPKEATQERVSYVTSNRVKLELGLSERQMLRLRKVQDLLSQTKRRPVSLEEAMEVLVSEFLRKHDPVEKAKRNQVRKGSNSASAPASTSASAPNPTLVATASAPSSVPLQSKLGPKQAQLVTRRVAIPAAILHRVRLRDQQRCRFVLPSGRRCNQSRWIEIHHRIPISQGGTHTLDNLITLCSAHHKYAHLPVAQLEISGVSGYDLTSGYDLR